MASTDNRAARRRASRIRDAAEVLKKVAIILVIAAVILAALAGVGIFLAERATEKVLVKMKDVPQPMKVADLTGEQLAELVEAYDPDFYSHKGISAHAAGLHTITQRLVTQYYFDDYQAWLEWLPSCFDAWALNRKMTKDEQLRLFVNTFHFGTSREHEVNGFQQAADSFFAKKFYELNRDEYLQIVAMIGDPDKYHIQAEAMANIDREERLKKLLDGKCKRSSVFDKELKNCK